MPTSVLEHTDPPRAASHGQALVCDRVHIRFVLGTAAARIHPSRAVSASIDDDIESTHHPTHPLPTLTRLLEGPLCPP